MSSCVINEQKLYDAIYFRFQEISKFYEECESDDANEKRKKEKKKRDALYLWKTGEVIKLMGLLKNKDNMLIVSHAITFILSLEREEETRGINVYCLGKSARKQFREILQSEFLEGLSN